MEAIILAGGFGTRLAQIIPDLPKPMAPIAGRPFLWYLLNVLKAQGFQDVNLSIGYKASVIEQAFGDRYETVALAYCVEKVPLGTGGAIRWALSRTKSTGNIFVLNGDTFAQVDYRDMQQQHEESGAQLTVALMHVPDVARYGAVITEGEWIREFCEKGSVGPGLINSGVYLMDRYFFSELERQVGPFPETFAFEREILSRHSQSLRIGGFVAGGYFIDIGIPEDYERAQTELPEHLSRL